MKKLGIWIFVTGGLTLVLFVASIVFFTSFIHSPTLNEPRQQLVSGTTVHIEEDRPHQIFLEYRLPPMLASHEFTFTNIATGEQVTSRAPSVTSTYQIGGAHGRAVAVVDLLPGSYLIEFEPWDGGGIFVWGTDMFGTIFGGVIGIFALGGVSLLSLAAFAVLLAFYITRKISIKKGVPHETNQTPM